MFLTACAVGILGSISLYTKVEFMTSKWVGYFFLGHFILNIFGLLFFGLNSTLYGFMSGIAVSIYLVIDIQMLMDDKRIQMSVDDYVFASINIYLDIIQIFLKILEFLDDGKKKKKERR